MTPYKKTSKIAKGRKFVDALHICGYKLFDCVSCGRVFCPECDAFFPKIPDCCKKSSNALLKAREKKENWKEKIEETAGKRRIRYKIEIKEIGNEL